MRKQLFNARNSAKQGIQTFCNQTSMHGFVELFNAKNIGWSIVWGILLVGALGLTTYQVSRAVNQFVEQTSNTRAEPANHNDMYPPVKICAMHWVYWIDWEKAFSMKFTKDSILYGMSYLTSIYTTNSSFNIQTAKSQFFKGMTLNNFTKMQQFYKSVAKTFPLLKSSVNPSKTFDQIQMFVSSLWGPLLCYSTSGEVIMQSTLNNSDQDYPAVSFFIKVQGYSMTNNNITMNEYNFYAAQYLSDTGFYIDKMDGKFKDFSTYSSPFLLYVDGYSQDYLPIRDEDDLYTVGVSISANRFRPDADFDCLLNQKYIKSNGTSICPNYKALYPDTVCRCKTLAQTVLTNTDDPSTLCQNKFFLIFNENNTASNIVPENGFIGQNSCTTNDTAKKLQDASPKCLFPCEVWSYSFSYIIEKFGTTQARTYFTKSGTGIRIVYPNNYDIYIMVEVERQTWEDFVANIGGLLGVWTGASLISVVQLFYLCCFSQIETKWSFTLRSKKNGVVAFVDQNIDLSRTDIK